MAERTIVGGVDTYVSQVTPSRSDDNRRTWALVKNESGANSRLLLYIKAPAPVTAGTTVSSATLRIRLKTASTGNLSFSAAPVGASWKGGKVTWNNQPDLATGSVLALPATASVTGASQGTDVVFDVGPHMQAVADGAGWFGWRITCTTNNQLATVYTTQAAIEGRRPVLTVEYSNAPSAPTDLSPSGGFFVSIQKPTLRYTFIDTGGNRELVAQQVQIQPTSGTSGSNFDSGTVATSEPEYATSTSSWPGVVNGGSWRWRVRAQDGAGLWSPWSDWAHFERLNKGSLTLNNPSPAPNDFVQDVTPPITWTHSGTWAQEAYQVVVEQRGILDSWFQVYNSRKRTGSDDSLTIPSGVLTKADWSALPGNDDWSVPTKYRVTVRTWDGQQRQGTPGDPVYYQVRREFTVKEGTTASVTGFQVTQLSPWPFAELRWTRSTAPDKFVIIRGGQVIAEKTPDQLDVSSGVYRWVDKRATLNREHTWSVVPVVNGKMSTTEAAVVTTQINADGIWLIDPDRDQRDAVLILGLGGQADVSMAAEDRITQYEVIGRSAPVDVTHAVGIAAGSVSGVVTTHPALPNIDQIEWRDRLRDFKSEPGKRLILVTMDYAMPVTIKNVSDWPVSQRGVIGVSFDFTQDSIPSYAEID